MTDFEKAVSDAIETLRRRWLDQGGHKTVALCDWLGPQIAAALDEAVSAAFQNVNGAPYKTWRSEALAELGRGSGETPQP